MELVNALFNFLTSIGLTILILIGILIGAFLIMCIIAIIKVFIDIMRGRVEKVEKND